MRASIKFLISGFNRFNNEIFGGELPLPLMHISSARTFMGQFKVERSGSILGKHRETYHITLSKRYELEESDLEDVLIHEMIHFLIHYRKIHDTSSHGRQFRTLMNNINRRFNRHITVSHRCTKEQLASDTAKSHSIVCICTMTDGRRLVCRVSQSKLFEIHRAFQNWDQVVKEDWYWVYGSYCNRLRKVLTPRLFSVESEGLEIIESGTKLEFFEESGGRMALRLTLKHISEPTLRLIIA
ncbi:MAG: SprT-like domain-containing protein [Muribaculaceae bacterium]|nr:SprT-like domain-containing protein [Muribaculaceae bacterium]